VTTLTDKTLNHLRRVLTPDAHAVSPTVRVRLLRMRWAAENRLFRVWHLLTEKHALG
jgi:hypothetical protein